MGQKTWKWEPTKSPFVLHLGLTEVTPATLKGAEVRTFYEQFNTEEVHVALTVCIPLLWWEAKIQGLFDETYILKVAMNYDLNVK